MPAVATWPLFEALAARLTSHEATSGLAWTADDVPDAALPTGRVGPSFGVGADTLSSDGAEETVQIDYWAATRQAAAEALAAVTVALRAPLTVTGYDVTGPGRLVSSEVFQEDEPGRDRIWHGAARYRFTLTET